MEKESKYKITHLARRPMVIGGSIEVVCFDAEEADDTLELLQAEEARANAAEAERDAKEKEAEEWESKLRSEQVALGRMEAKVDGVIRERDALRAELDALRAAPLRAAPLSAGEWKPGDTFHSIGSCEEWEFYTVEDVWLEDKNGAYHKANYAHRTQSAAHLARADELRKLADEHKSKANEFNKEQSNGEKEKPRC